MCGHRWLTQGALLWARVQRAFWRESGLLEGTDSRSGRSTCLLCVLLFVPTPSAGFRLCCLFPAAESVLTPVQVLCVPSLRMTARLRTVYFHEQGLVMKWFGTEEWDELTSFLKFFIIKTNHVHYKRYKSSRFHTCQKTPYYKYC